MFFQSKILKIIEKVFLLFAIIALSVWGVKASDKYFFKNENDGPCPPEMVFIDTEYGGFCIDKYENSVGEGCPYVNPKSKSESALNLAVPECEPVSQKGASPWNNITQSQAIEACAKAGKRLPSAKEWYLASLGTQDKQENWGSDDCHVAKNWANQPGLTGSAKNCHSSFGVFDMIGNVWEWVKEEVNNGEYKGEEMPDSGYVEAVDVDGMIIKTSSSPDDVFYSDFLWIKKKGLRAMARGGYWDNKEKAGKNAVYLVSPSSFSGIGVGFRCVK